MRLGTEEQLENLYRQAAKSKKSPTEMKGDSVFHLTFKKRRAWAGILSSLATGEATEEAVMEPLAKAFSFNEKACGFLKYHSQDEARHAVMLKAYVKNTFYYEKKTRSLTDRVIYDRFFPLAARFAPQRPSAFLGGILYYEIFIEEFYKSLRDAAKRDGLPGLVHFIDDVCKDELRHRAGVVNLISLWKREKGRPDWKDILGTAVFLSMIWLDLNTHKWALYNRHIRENMRVLGLDADQFARRSAEVLRSSLSELTGNN